MDSSDFQKIYDRYRGPVYNFFANRSFSQEECRDLVQETFYRAFRGAPDFRGEAQIGTWLISIAANIWREEMRRRSRRKRSAQELSLETLRQEKGFEPPEEAARGQLHRALVGEEVQMLHEALLELPPQMRQCLRLRIIQGLRYREIAEVMQISVGTVKSQIAKAKTRLQERLQVRISWEPRGKTP